VAKIATVVVEAIVEVVFAEDKTDQPYVLNERRAEPDSHRAFFHAFSGLIWNSPSRVGIYVPASESAENHQ